MKKKITICFVCLSLLLVSLAVRGQDTKTTRRVPLQAEVTHDGLSEKESKAWEIGLGGSLINWSRVSVTGFRSTPDNYFYNLKANHLMGGANLYIARELNRWFYLDLQGSVGLTKNNNRTAGDDRKRDLLYMGGGDWGYNSALLPCSDPNGLNLISG